MDMVATATNTVEVTVTGVNDAPEIDSEGSSGEVVLSPGSAPFLVEQWTSFFRTHGTPVDLNELLTHAANNAPTHTATTNIIDYTDDPNGFAGLIPGSSPWPAAQATGATATNDPVNDNFMSRITTNIVITEADTYTFRTFNDDGVFLFVNGQAVITDPNYHGEQQFTGSLFLNPGVYPLELYFFEGGGEASLELAFSNSGGVFQHVGAPEKTDSGSIQFTDVDLSDTHTASATAVGTALGTMTAVVAADTTGTGEGGIVNWEYSVDNNAYQNLGEGDTATETFIVSVDDGNGGVAQETVEITIVGANDPAVLGNAVEGITETDEQQTIGGTLSISDPDDNEAFFNEQTDTEGAFGFFSIDANGNWSYTTDGALDELAEGQLETEIFQVTSLDGTTTNVTINITGTADGPTAEVDSNSLTASSAVVNTDNTVYWVDWTPTTLTPAPFGGRDVVHTINGVIDLVPGTDEDDIHVTYVGQVFTGATQLAGGTDYYVTKNGGFGGPVVSTEGVGVYTSAEVGNGPSNNDIIALNHADSPRNLTFTDKDGNPLSVDNLFFAIVSMNNNGYLFDQEFSVVSNADTSANSGFWGYSAGFNLVPGGPGQLGISTLGISPNEFHGVLEIENALQSLTWTSKGDEPWNGFTIGTYGPASSATASGNVLTNDDIGGAGPIEVSDVDGNAMVGNSVTINLPSGAILKVDKDGDYLYDDNGAFGYLGANDDHTDVVTYTVKDANGNTDTATLSITVNGANEAPVAATDSVHDIDEDSGPVSISFAHLLDNDTDVDNGDTKTVISVQDAVGGTVAIVGSDVVFTPAANFNGAATFNYTMQDSAGATSTALVAVLIDSVPDIYTAQNLVTNGSFESGLTGWSTIAGGVDHLPWDSADGTYMLDLNAFERGGVEQVLTGLEDGASYSVYFSLSQNPGASSSTVRVEADGTFGDFTYTGSTSSTNMNWSSRQFDFEADGTSALLSFTSLTPSTPQGFPDDAEGPALDEVVVVTNQVIENFDVGEGGDILDLVPLLTSIDADPDVFAFFNGYLNFDYNGSDTVVQIDPNGGGDSYLNVMTLVGVQLTLTDEANFLLI